MDEGRSSSCPTNIGDANSAPKRAPSALLRRELDRHHSQRQRAVSLASIEPFAGSAGRLHPTGVTAALPKLTTAAIAPRPANGPPPAAVPPRFNPPSVYVPKFAPPPAPRSVPAAAGPAPPVLSAQGAPPLKPEFARRMELKARLEKGAKKRSIDLVRPTYATAPKAGGIKPKKGKGNTMLLQLFSAQQQLVIDMIHAGKSVFFTGSAGTGKSTLLRALREMLPTSTTYVTASTGMAAISIGGLTLHQFAGIGTGQDPLPILLQRVLKSKAKENWVKVKVLIIDEVSMVDGELFEKLEYIAREVRRNQYPFGGIQLVCCGDFFQLPPVSRNNNATFAFESPKWAQTIQCNIELTTVYRQSDANFVRILNEIRHGKVSDESRRALEACKNVTLKAPEGIEPTRLSPLNKDVDGMNQSLLDALPGAVKEYKALDRGEERFRNALANHSAAPTLLQLKEGAQVILLKNLSLDHGLGNGARGVVIGFDEQNRYLPIIRFVSGVEKTIDYAEWPIEIAGTEVASRSQVPLRLGWAISIHKSQGLTLSFAEVSLAAVFEYGQAYVALSRVSSLAGLKLLDFDPKVVRAHPKVIKYYETFDDVARSVVAAPQPAAAVDAIPPPPPRLSQQSFVTLDDNFAE